MATNKRERQKANREGNRTAAAEAADQSAQQRKLILIGTLVAIIAVVVAIVAFSGGDDADTQAVSDTSTDDAIDDSATDSADADPTPVCPAEDGSSPRTIDFTDAQPMCIDPAQTHVAIFDTSEGVVRVELNTADTPETVNNFVTLARWGYYDGTTIFRTDLSIDIIQGGSPHSESASDQGPGYSIVDEPTFDLDPATSSLTGPYRYVPGQLVMARASGRDSAGAQFFFTTGSKAALLDGQGVYVVFGETDEAGLSVLQDIIGLHVAGGNLGGAPSRTVTINSVTIEAS